MARTRRTKQAGMRRTTITLAMVIAKRAECRMKERGFNRNFSAYVADLIRRDWEASQN